MGFPRVAELWVPLALPAEAQPGPNELVVTGRLAKGVSIHDAQAELDIFGTEEARLYPNDTWTRSTVLSLDRQVIGDIGRPLLLFLGAVGVVLLVVCSNIANLLLTRSISRRREFAIRAALGAGQGRLMRQLITESLVLSAAGGVLGMLLARFGVRLVRDFGPANIPRLHEVGIDPIVFAFTLILSLITGLLVGLAPSLVSARTDINEALKSSSQRSMTDANPKLRNGLLVGEIALALVLLIATGLLVQTFEKMLRTNAGFIADRALTFQLSLPKERYRKIDDLTRTYRKILGGIEAIPPVEAAGVVSAVPMGGAPDATTIRIPGHVFDYHKQQPFVNYSFASRAYFSAIGATLVRGRYFLETDTLDSAPVAIINRALANKYFRGENPIGRQIGVRTRKWPVRTIVGVIADIKHASLREDVLPEMYVPYTQNEIQIWPSMQSLQVAVRSKAESGAIMASVRQALRSVDPDLPVSNIATLGSLVDDSMAQPRFSMILIASFGALAVLLACVGVYGVVSYSVAQRTPELGVRIALGAEPRAIFANVLGHGALLAGIGIILGLLVSAIAMRALSGFLYGIQTGDPLTFASASILLLAVAMFSCWLPARRATKVDPLVALRSE